MKTPTILPMAKSSVTRKGQQCIDVMGEEFMTSEVMENDVVSGIEIAPSKSCGESVSTASTEPITTDSSESWSISSDSLVDATTNTSDDSEEDENDQAPPTRTRTPLFCNTGNLVNVEGFCGPVYGRRRKLPIPRKQSVTSSPAVTRYCDVQEERTRVEMVLVVRLNNKASLNSEKKGIVSTVENQPDRLLSSVISKTTSLLCMMSLKATNLPFLLNSVTHSSVSNAFSLQPPFVMFPNKSSVFVAKHKDSDIYQLVSRGPIPVDSLSQLFDMQDRMEGLFVSILAFHDGIPPLVGNDPLSLNGNQFSILLDDWRRKRRNKKKSETETEKDKQTSLMLQPRKKMQIDVDDECGNFVCNPGLLPLMTSPRTANDETDLLRDDELRAVMKITQNGNDTSALFPCFSTGSDSLSCESDDGLRDEMGALESLQKELQMELETAKETIKELDTPKASIEELETHAESIDGTDAIDIAAGKEPIGILPSLKKRQYQIPLPPPTLPPPRSRRRVRFSKTHTEHIFISEIVSISDESAEDYGCGEFHLDEYTYALEEVMEELTNAFVQRLQYFRPRQPKGRVATRSNTHFF
jgi:hypothetical protein